MTFSTLEGIRKVCIQIRIHEPRQRSETITAGLPAPSHDEPRAQLSKTREEMKKDFTYSTRHSSSLLMQIG